MPDPDPPHFPDTHSSQPQRRGSDHAPGSSPQDTAGGPPNYLLIAEKIFGTAMVFIGFLNVLLSISGGYEINTTPLIIWCLGLAVWAHATIKDQTTRYAVIAAAILASLAFFHYGEVLFWHKQVLFWGTIALVVFFMFKSERK